MISLWKEIKLRSLIFRARLGNSEAQFHLGFLYHDGIGDTQKAIYWYERAALQNHASAQYNLAELYLLEDNDMAIYWLKKAAQNGVSEASKALFIFDSAINDESFSF